MIGQLYYEQAIFSCSGLLESTINWIMPKCSHERWVLASWAYFQSSRPRDSSINNYTHILYLTQAEGARLVCSSCYWPAK